MKRARSINSLIVIALFIRHIRRLEFRYTVQILFKIGTPLLSPNTLLKRRSGPMNGGLIIILLWISAIHNRFSIRKEVRSKSDRKLKESSWILSHLQRISLQAIPTLENKKRKSVGILCLKTDIG